MLSEEKDLATALKVCKRRVALHSEDESRLKERFIKIDKTKGVKQHEVWRDKESALLSTKKILKYAKKYNTKAHILHISTKDEIELIKIQKKYNSRSNTSASNLIFSKLLQKTWN